MSIQEIESNQDTEFAEFAAAGEVEDANANAGIEESDKGKKPAPKPAPSAKAPAAGDDAGDDAGEGEGDQGGDDGDEGDDGKPQKTAKDHQIERLKREKRDLMRQLRSGSDGDLVRRLENVEKGLQGGNTGDTKTAGKPAPDVTDTEKYPLGHLDDRYIEDKLEWLAEDKATKQADSVLRRQQEAAENQAVNAQQETLLTMVDELSAKGSDLILDFQEEVVEAGMRGDYSLGQATFEAACEADNGPQILFDLSQDKKEAKRVAGLSPFQQLKFVQERDAELGPKKARTKPKAGEPPKNMPRGANSKTEINPATNNLNDFERAWKLDEAKSK